MRRQLILALAALGAGAAVLVAPNAQPAISSDDLADVQAAHLAVIDEIAMWDALTPVSRIGSVRGDPAAGSIEIGWAGPVPSEVRAMAAEAAAEGIDITFVPQEASEAELVELAHDLAASMPTDGAFAIGIGADSLTVEVPEPEVAEAAGTEPIELDGEVLQTIDETQRAAEDIGVEVAVEQTDTVPTTAAARPLERGAPLSAGPGAGAIATGRSNDVSVLSGGMRVRTQFQSGAWISCTSGFAGVHGHQPVIVTAAHCSDYADGRGVRNLDGTTIGESDLVRELNDGARPYDLGVIAASYDARTLPRIYTNESATVSITGAQVTFPPAGYRLCSSGQITGWKCDLTAGDSYVTCYGTPRGNECMHVQLVTSSSSRAFCLGDSGGPVVGLPTSAGATAVGVVSGLRSNVAVSCSPVGIIAPLSQLFSTVPGLQIHTQPLG